MNKELIWWTLVNSSSAFIEQIKNSVEREKNTFVYCERPLPWKETFYEFQRKNFAGISSKKSLEFISAKGENDPGQFIMTRMCPQSVRSEYWPDITYAQFLSQYNDLILNNRIVWVKDIENDNQLEKWFDFISEYSKLSEEKNYDHATFVVEYSGKKSTKNPPNTVEKITFSPTYLDRYIFALSLLSEVNDVFLLKQYIAELACCLSRDDVEFCGSLIESGLKLAQLPIACVKEHLLFNRSDGTRFSDIDIDEIYSCVLRTQIKIIFPVIEQFRMNFIKTHETSIRANLPITNSFNEIIEEPNELELSDLCSIVRSYASGFTDDEKVLLFKYKNYRNKLAHNDIIDWTDVEKILNK